MSYSFPWASGSAIFSGINGGNYSSLNEYAAFHHYALNATQQAAARAALQSWANVANINFQEVNDTPTNVGDIRFAWTSITDTTSTGGQAWGWSQFPDAYSPAAGDIWISTVVTDTDWSAGSVNYSALIHEIGHSLGLKHPFETVNLVGVVLPTYLDTRQYTVMSYTDPANDLFRTVTYTANGATSLTYHVPCQTPMVLDIAAMQFLYGANTTYHTDDDTYTFDTGAPFYKTIWDAGGNDTISVSNFTENCRIDLTPGNYSSIKILSAPIRAGYIFTGGTEPTYDGTNNLGIAYNCIIENAVGGSGNDILTGNSANNRLDGGAGNDAITGAAGNDTLTGGAGYDTIDGGAGVDTAIFSGNRSNFIVTKSGTGFIVADTKGVNGTDALTNVERLQFDDTRIALDINGNAGITAKILGAVFGAAAVSNTVCAGIGLSCLDGGMSYADLTLLALNGRLGIGFTNADEVNLLYQNLVGNLPSTADLDYFVGTITSGQYTQATFGVMAADHSINTANINLVGLVQTGIEYSG